MFYLKNIRQQKNYMILLNSTYCSNKKNKPTDLSWLYGKWMKNDIEKQDKTHCKIFLDAVKSIHQEIKTIVKAKPIEEVTKY